MTPGETPIGIPLKILWEDFQEALRKLSGSPQEAHRRLSADSQEALRKLSGDSQELSGDSQELSGGIPILLYQLQYTTV